jgi:XisH protein
LGQFIAYRLALSELEPDRKLYLAIPIAAYTDFFQRPFPSRLIQENDLALLETAGRWMLTGNGGITT